MLRTLLIDNYDSYTYNLHQLAASAYGIEPVVVRNDLAGWDRIELAGIDALIVSPGPGRPQTPEDVGFAPQLIRRAGLPVLGVCLGHQLLAWMAGGRVGVAPRPRHGWVDRIAHVGRDLFADLPQRFPAVRYHSLCVTPPLPGALEGLAWAADGVLMGIRHRRLPWWGVQFHPESIGTAHGTELMLNFARLARRHRRPFPHPPRSEPAPGGAPGRRPGGGGLPALEPVPQRDERARPANEPTPPPSTPARRAAPPPARRLATRRLDFAADAERVFADLFGAHEFAFWLDSSGGSGAASRFSYLGAPGGAYAEVLCYRTGTGMIDVWRHGGWSKAPAADIFTVLRSRLADLTVVDPPDLPFALSSGYVGYFGYELKAECGAAATQISPTPDAVWMLADRMVVVDHHAGQTWVLAACGDDGRANLATMRWLDRAASVLTPPAAPRPEPSVWPGKLGDLEPLLVRSRDQYLTDIADCQRELGLGESYEICLTNTLVQPFDGDPFEVYRRLRRVNPAPYSAYLRIADLAVLSSSPERFVTVDRAGTAESRPIKGTAPRHPDPTRDKKVRERLRTDPKTRAENLMIVDLLRNDLGTVSEIGSVTVPRYLEVETYATLHQLVSTVRGRLRPGVTAVDAVRACFPGGSMTGAPKIRTMEIIDRLEGTARGVYSGALGYFSCTGEADLSIVIRAAVVAGHELSVGAGGAIVVASNPESEYAEMLLKALSCLRALDPDGAAGQPARTA